MAVKDIDRREQIGNHPMLGIWKDADVGSDVGCSARLVWSVRQEKGIPPAPKKYHGPRIKPTTTFTPTPISEVAQLLERWRA